MPGRRESRLPIGAALADGGRLFLKSLTAVFLPLWAANFVAALPGMFAGGGLLGGSFNRRDVLLTIVAWCIESLLYGYSIVKLDARARDLSVTQEQAWRAGLHAIPAILIGDLVYNVIAWGGLLVFVVPGIIFGTTLVFFAYAAVLERKNVIAALGYSHALTWPDWWRSSAVISVPAIVLFVYGVIMGWPAIVGAVHALAAGRLPGAASLSHPWYDLGLMPLLGALAWAYALSVLYVQYRALQARAVVH